MIFFSCYEFIVFCLTIHQEPAPKLWKRIMDILHIYFYFYLAFLDLKHLYERPLPLPLISNTLRPSLIPQLFLNFVSPSLQWFLIVII